VNDPWKTTKDLGLQLGKALSENAFLRAENERLKKMLGLSREPKDPPVSSVSPDPAPFLPHLTNDSPPDAKVSLFDLCSEDGGCVSGPMGKQEGKFGILACLFA